MHKVIAVIVTFHSDREMLLRLLEAVSNQVEGGVIVNNSQDLSVPSSVYTQLGFELLQMPCNLGVAGALNAGFAWAQQHGASFVITFDQDSMPAPDMVNRLMQAYTELVTQGQDVGAVGPQQVDRRTLQKTAFLRPVRWFRHQVVPDTEKAVEVDHLISSGCLAPVTVWLAAGPFLDELFIDYVDIEWSLRLRHEGKRLFGVGGAILWHSIGDDVTRWVGKNVLHHTPLRHYFMFRNGLYLQRLPYITSAWKISDAVQMAKKFLLFGLTGRPRHLHIRAMLTGLTDGWRGRMGPANHHFLQPLSKK